MTDNENPNLRPDDPTDALPAVASGPTATSGPAAPAGEPALTPAATVDWRDRVLGIRGVTAVALASVILGGAGGAVLGTVAGSSDDQRGQIGQFGGPGQMNGQGLNGTTQNGQLQGQAPGGTTQNGQMVPPVNGQLPPALPQGQDATSSDASVEG
jgi:hypothetical protein